MNASADFRDLLFADVALVEGHASARHVAAALLKYWDRRDRVERSLADELATTAGIGEADMAAISKRVEELVSAANGDPRLAVTERGGLTHELHVAVSRQDHQASRQLTELGAGIRFELRELPKDRYLDFMPVGEGGMGIVYWAMDTELGRQVAFKVVRPPTEGMGSGVTPPAPLHMQAPSKGDRSTSAFEELKARFLQEAWVTGGMEHPGIVPVYEIGRTRGGVPYYTMRFVRGHRTLETALDERRARGFDTRIELLEPFLRVCDAIAYAHNRGVIHRDLKPANVALGEYGEAVVLDWGLAKLGAQPDVFASRWQEKVSDFRDAASMKTMTSALGTPGYMSPEAAAGRIDEVGASSDVYSLGVMLFEIATGVRPFEFKSFEEYASKVNATDAPDASTVEPAVPADLAAICASALARHPSRRPNDVATLATQIRNWQRDRATKAEVRGILAEAELALEDNPSLSPLEMTRHAERATVACQRVLARRPDDSRAKVLLAKAHTLRDESIRARARRSQKMFLRKLALGALAGLAVVGAAVAYLMNVERQKAEDARHVAKAERDNAQRHRQRAEEAIGFITEELRDQLEPEGRLDILATIAERARAHFESIPVETDHEESFALRMRALRQLGEVNLARGDLEGARRAFQEAVSECDKRLVVHGRDARTVFERNRAVSNVARVDLAQGFPRRGADKLQAVVEALNDEPFDGIGQNDLTKTRVRAQIALAHSLRGVSDRDTANEVASVALKEAESWLSRHPTDLDALRLAAEAGMSTALMAYLTNNAQRSDLIINLAVTRAKMMRSNRVDNKSIAAFAAHVLGRKAWLCRYTRRHEEAEQILVPAIEIMKRLTRERPSNMAWRAQLAYLLLTLGDARARSNREYTQGFDAFTQSYDTFKELHARDPSNASWIHALITLCDRHAAIAAKADPRDAVAELRFRRQAIQFAEALSALEPENPRWRFLVVWTTSAALVLERDPQRIKQGRKEARQQCRYVMRRIVDATDVLETWQLLSISACSDEQDPLARIAIAADGLREFRRATQSKGATVLTHKFLGAYVHNIAGILAASGEDGIDEVRRQQALVRSWYQAEIDGRGRTDDAWKRAITGYLARLNELDVDSLAAKDKEGENEDDENKED